MVYIKLNLNYKKKITYKMECIVCIKTVHQKKEECVKYSYKYVVLFVYTCAMVYLLKYIKNHLQPKI